MTDKLQRLVDLMKENGNEFDLEGIETIVDGDWSQEHKYQFRESIVSFEGDLFSVNENRSGSYHTDWDYGDVEVAPVERKVETREVVTYISTGPSTTIPSTY